MTLREPSSESPHSQLLFDAYAMNRRILGEVQTAYKISAEYFGDPFTPLDEATTGLVALVGAYQTVDSIEGRPLNTPERYVEEAVDAVCSRGLEGLIGDTAEELSALDPAALRTHMLSFVTNLRDFGQASANAEREQSVDMYRKAQEMCAAEQDDCTVEDIFKDDARYGALMRYTYAPDDFAARHLETAENTTLAATSDLIIRNAETVMRLDIDAGIGNFTQEDLDGLQEWRTTADFRARVLAAHTQLRGANLAILNFMLNRFWGGGVTGELSLETRQRMRALDVPVATVRDYTVGSMVIRAVGKYDEAGAAMEKRAEVTRRYCDEHNLRPEDLTIEEILKIRDLPEWQNPL